MYNGFECIVCFNKCIICLSADLSKIYLSNVRSQKQEENILSLALFSGRQGIYPRPRAFDKCQGPCAFDSCQGPTLLIKIVALRAPHIPYASGPTGAKNSPAKFFPFPSLRNDLLICLDSKVWNPQPVRLRLYPGA